MGAKKCSDDAKELNMRIVLAITKAMKMNKKSKVKDASKSENNNQAEQFNLRYFRISVDGDSE